MRTIKFRGQDEDGKWLYGDLRQRMGYWPAIIESYCTDEGKVGYREIAVKEGTVGQFTSLRDKNGRDIYEGDILECVSWNEFWSVDGKPLEQLRRRLLVGHRHGAFVCIERQQAPFDDKVWDIISNQDCIIIGNIYDNPELWPKRQPFECNF